VPLEGVTRPASAETSVERPGPSQPAPGRRTRLAALSALLALLLTTAVLEGGLRLLGRAPWTPDRDDRGQPVVFQPDPVLGWSNKEGRYLLHPYAPGAPATVLTNWSRGRRATRPEPTAKPRRIVIVGDSFTQGWAISDEETYPWKLQERFADFEVFNLGAGGYGTYQSLLALERYYAEIGGADLVIYGFLSFHDLRNVATAEWLKHLSLHSRRQGVRVPYVTLDASGALVRHPPTEYPSWPLREWLASVDLLEDAYARWTIGSRADDQALITERLVREMKLLAEGRHSRFLVAVLGLRDESDLRLLTQFKRDGVRYLSCEGVPTPQTTVPGEGHPNGVMNTFWADCIEKGIRAQNELR